MVDVSVIIPTRNRPALLARALKSVCAQHGALQIECFVVDDGDTAGADCIRNITDAAGAVYLRSEKAGGIGGVGGAVARNRGVEMASGTYIAFLDDDDTWMPDKLSKQIGMMHGSALPFSYTGMLIVDKRGKSRYSFRTPPAKNVTRAIMRRNFIGTTSTVIIKRDVLTEVGGFDTRLTALQDYDLYIRLLQRYPLTWLKEPLTTYFTEAATENVSAGRHHFFQAVALLSGKYRSAPFYYLLRLSFIEIFLLKCVRSPRFLSSTLRLLSGRG